MCSESSFQLEAALNGNKILLFDLSYFGPESQIALGKFLIANVMNYVRKRDASTSKHTYLIVDEAPLFVGSGKSYEVMLSQLRKFGLHVFLAAQYANQFGSNLESVR